MTRPPSKRTLEIRTRPLAAPGSLAQALLDGQGPGSPPFCRASISRASLCPARPDSAPTRSASPTTGFAPASTPSCAATGVSSRPGTSPSSSSVRCTCCTRLSPPFPLPTTSSAPSADRFFPCSGSRRTTTTGMRSGVRRFSIVRISLNPSSFPFPRGESDGRSVPNVSTTVCSMHLNTYRNCCQYRSLRTLISRRYEVPIGREHRFRRPSRAS